MNPRHTPQSEKYKPYHAIYVNTYTFTHTHISALHVIAFKWAKSRAGDQRRFQPVTPARGHFALGNM